MDISELLAFNPKKSFSTVEDEESEAVPKKQRKLNYQSDPRSSNKKSRIQLPKVSDENAINSASTVKKINPI